MARQGISTGITPNDGLGDSLLTGATKINSNFSEIYTAFGDGTNLNQNVGSALTVSVRSGLAGTNSNEVQNVTAIRFNGPPFNVTNLGNGEVFVTSESTFKTWYVDGQPTLVASGDDYVEFVAGAGIAITTKNVSSGVGTGEVKSLTITSTVEEVTYTSTAGVATYASTAGVATYASTAGVATNINITGTNPIDSTTYLLVSQNLATGSQAVYTKNTLLFDSNANILYASTGGTHSGTVDNNLTKTKTFVTKDDLNNDISYTSAYQTSSSGIGSTSISLVGTSATLPLSFEMIISIYPTNLGFGSANDMQITKLLGVFDGQSIVSFVGYSTSFVNVPSSLASFNIDNTGDFNSLRLNINPTGVGNTTEYKYKINMTYFFPY